MRISDWSSDVCSSDLKYLGPLRQKPGVKLLEIGVACGSSLKTWSRYFSDAEIIGADIRPDCSQLCRSYPNIRIEIGNATQQTFARDCDVIIDDGSHVSADIVDALRVNWPALKPDGPRPEERRAGKGWVSTGRSRGW